jgi:hypothetical protein
MKIKICIVFLLLIAALGCSKKDEESLELAIESHQEVYKSGDDIRMRLILENNGSEPVLVNERMAISYSVDYPFGEISFVIITPSGQTAYVYVKYGELRPDNNDFVVLESREKIVDEYVLNEIYEPLYEAGTYSIQAIYHNIWDPKNGEIAWKGQVESDKINFVITP